MVAPLDFRLDNEGERRPKTMKPQQERLAELHQDYDSMAKFFLFASKRTKDVEKKKKYELSAGICESMKEVTELLFEASEEILGEKGDRKRK